MKQALRFRKWIYAALVAHKYVDNWLLLLLLALLNRKGVFYSKVEGCIRIEARKLLKFFVRHHSYWEEHGDAFPAVKFSSSGFIEIPYFGFSLHLPVDFPLFERGSIPPPAALKREYDVEVKDCVVLDVGAYIGDTVLYWLSKGAKKVIAIEPVPKHYKVLTVNSKDKPVVAINTAVGVRIPALPEYVGLSSYGIIRLKDFNDAQWLNVPVTQLSMLVEKYKPDVVKIDCEGCEHFCVKDFLELPKMGVKTLIIEIHNAWNKTKETLLHSLQEVLGEGKITIMSKRVITAIWNLS
ncbi:MAG: FkbM family methyltransferase [Candidatus Bathyarchaeia archaeon]